MRDYVIADVFTDVPLQGNPVAVFTHAAGLDAEVMQRTARELNLAETVFLTPADGEADVRARIFTPAVEMPFAGHPVLGTAFVVAQETEQDVVRIGTGAGVIPVKLQRDGDAITFGEMDQPIPTWEPFGAAGALLGVLGVEDSGLPIEIYDNGPRHTFVELPDEAAVAGVRPDFRGLFELGEFGVSCFAVSDGAGAGTVKTRMFAPGLGVSEDPATGSAAGPLSVHLARHGRTAFGQRLEIRQGEEIGRPSLIHAVTEGGPERVERVAVGGSAVIVARGQYLLD
ncbi:MAG: PhzF family phenazine biosynthesis protein [Solirubrobacteraceae bacterium]